MQPVRAVITAYMHTVRMARGIKSSLFDPSFVGFPPPFIPQRTVPGHEAVPPIRRGLHGTPDRDVLHAVPLQRPPAQLLHPHLALRLHELRPVPPGLVHEPGEFSLRRRQVVSGNLVHESHARFPFPDDAKYSRSDAG